MSVSSLKIQIFWPPVVYYVILLTHKNPNIQQRSVVIRWLWGPIHEINPRHSYHIYWYFGTVGFITSIWDQCSALLGARLREGCRICHYLSWTDSILPNLFSNFECCVSKGSLFRLFRIHNSCRTMWRSWKISPYIDVVLLFFTFSGPMGLRTQHFYLGTEERSARC